MYYKNLKNNKLQKMSNPAPLHNVNELSLKNIRGIKSLIFPKILETKKYSI